LKIETAETDVIAFLWTYFLTARFAELIFEPNAPFLAIHPNFIFYRHLVSLANPTAP
jgi:hypothetical protein